MAKALLAAARGHHTDIVMCILKKDTSIMEQSIKDTPLFRQAMQDDLSCVFEVRLVSMQKVCLYTLYECCTMQHTNVQYTMYCACIRETYYIHSSYPVEVILVSIIIIIAFKQNVLILPYVCRHFVVLTRIKSFKSLIQT